MMLVTLAQVREHLLSDNTDNDADLTLKIEAASAVVVDYLGAASLEFLDSSGDPVTDSSGDLIVPARVQQATLLTVAEMVLERGGSKEHTVDAQFGYGYALPKGAVGLLYSMRAPTVL